MGFAASMSRTLKYNRSLTAKKSFLKSDLYRKSLEATRVNNKTELSETAKSRIREYQVLYTVSVVAILVAVIASCIYAVWSMVS